MQVVSWQQGQEFFTDFPDCADPMLARVVQWCNDRMCSERRSYHSGNVLCPECSMAVLGLADWTVGTRLSGRSTREVELVYARLAVERADHVASLAQDNHEQVRRAIATAWECILNPDATDRIGALNLADAIPVAMPSSDSTSKDVMVAVSSAARIAAHYAHDLTMGFRICGAEISSAAPAITIQRSLGALNAKAHEGCQHQIAKDAHHVVDRFRELADLPEPKAEAEVNHAREQGGELADAL
jgi:uncharacterized low-complexity protein